jgi:hypothetical protein
MPNFVLALTRTRVIVISPLPVILLSNPRVYGKKLGENREVNRDTVGILC